MNLFSNITIWDVVLILAVAVKGTLVARIRRPRLKSFFTGNTVPFTLAEDIHHHYGRKNIRIFLEITE